MVERIAVEDAVAQFSAGDDSVSSTASFSRLGSRGLEFLSGAFSPAKFVASSMQRSRGRFSVTASENGSGYLSNMVIVEEPDGGIGIAMDPSVRFKSKVVDRATDRLEAGNGTLEDLIATLDPSAKPPYEGFKRFFYRPGEGLFYLDEKLAEIRSEPMKTIQAARTILLVFLCLDALVWIALIVHFLMRTDVATLEAAARMSTVVFNLLSDALGAYVAIRTRKFVLFHALFLVGILLAIMAYSQPLFALRCFAILVSVQLRTFTLMNHMEPEWTLGVAAEDLEFYQPQGPEYAIVVTPRGTRSAAAQFILR